MSGPTATLAGSPPVGPLTGVKVLDLSIALTGPYAVALLADQGADVVKVERPGIGDIARWIGVSVNGMSALYQACNRGKRRIAVDLQQPRRAANRAGSSPPTPTWSCRTSGPAWSNGSDWATTTCGR